MPDHCHYCGRTARTTVTLAALGAMVRRPLIVPACLACASRAIHPPTES